MNISINTKKFANAIVSVLKAIPVKAVDFRLSDVVIIADAKNKIITLLTSNTESAVKINLPINEDTVINEEGSLEIPARILWDIIKAVEDKTVTISSISDNTAKIAWTTGHGEIPAYNPKDYPEIKYEIKDKVTIHIPGKILSEGIDSIKYAISNDAIRPALNGIFFNAEETGLILVATDAHRLGISVLQDCFPSEPSSFILPVKAAAIVSDVFAGCDSVELNFDNKHAIFSSEGNVVSVTNVIGKFPDYKSVIPKDNNNILTIEKNTLKDAIKLVSVCNSKSKNTVKIEINPEVTGTEIIISAEDIGFQTQAEQKIQANDYTGEALSIAFKSDFILETLSSLPGDSIRIEMSTTKRPVYFYSEKGEEKEDKTPGLLISSILMPVLG